MFLIIQTLSKYKLWLIFTGIQNIIINILW